MANRMLVLYVLKRNGLENRLGITVSKKVGISVIRSRVTRLIKESYRINEPLFETGYDLVFIARVAAKQARFHEIEQSVLQLMKRHRLIRPGGVTTSDQD